MIVWLLLACTVRPYGPVVVSPPDPPPVVSALPVEPLLARIDAILAASQEVDRRDRMVELRDLVVAAQAMEGRAQARVLRYAERAVVVEERAQPSGIAEQAMEMATDFEPVVEVTVQDADPLVAARAALEAGRPLDAVAACDAVLAADAASAPAKALRGAAVDAWARAEVEGAGRDVLAARALPAGPARTSAIEAARARLQAVNDRFPDNSLAEEVRRHLATVQQELSRP